MKDKIIRLIIIGFQSHKKTVIEFDMGFNAIIGPTGSGKSAVIRAIQFVLFNELPDNNFITIGADRCEVTIIFASGKEITRIRDKKDNIYILRRPGMDDITMSGFGDGPIEDVMNFHGIKSIRLGKKDVFVTFHGQHDQPFFLTENPADKAKVIGSLAKTDIVDIAISDMAADIKREQIRDKDLKNKIKEQDTILESFEHLDEMKRDLVTIQEKADSIKINDVLVDKISDSENNFNDRATQYKRLKKVLSQKDAIDQAIDLMEKIRSRAERIRKVETTWDDMDDNIWKMKRCSKVVNRINENDFIAVATAINFLSQNQSLITKLTAIKTDLSENIERLQHYMQICDNQDEIEKACQSLTMLLAEQQNIKQFVTSSANLSNEISRFHKGIDLIASRKEAIDSTKREIEEEIEQNPICTICGSDLRDRKEQVLNA